MPGTSTNGLPTLVAVTQNGTASVPPLGQYTILTSAGALIAADTETTAGQAPQSVAVNPFHIACAAMALINNTATSTVHTATLNTMSGMMVTEALTTAAGSDYTFQLVNSLITATGAVPKVQIKSGTNTAGALRVKSITNATGTATVVFTNTGTAALNGTMLIGFHV